MCALKNSGKYDDIIDLPRPVSRKRAGMSNYDRAAQFSPFAALTGYDGVIQETGRLTDSRIELGEDGKHLLDEKLRYLRQHIGERPCVTVTYFQPDERKQGGAYVNVEGRLLKMDGYRNTLTLEDGKEIAIDAVLDISCEMKLEEYGYELP